MEGRVEVAGWGGRVWPRGGRGWPPARLGKVPGRERVVRGLLVVTVSVVGVEAGGGAEKIPGNRGRMVWEIQVES